MGSIRRDVGDARPVGATAASRIVYPGLAVLLCWQFQADTGASQRDDPDLGHTDVLRDLHRMSGKVLGGLAGQQIDLHPRRRPGIRRHHSRSVQRLAAGHRVFGACQPALSQAVLNASDQKLDFGPRSVSDPYGGQLRSPGTSRDQTTPTSSTSSSDGGKVSIWNGPFIDSDS